MAEHSIFTVSMPDSRSVVMPVKTNVDQEFYNKSRSFRQGPVILNMSSLLQQYLSCAPASPDEEMHPRFVEALNNLPFIEYQLDVLPADSDFDKRQIATDYLQKKKEQKGINEFIVKFQ